MKKKSLFLLLLVVSSVGFTQNVLDGVYIKEHVPTRKVVPLEHLREADVAWNRRYWRVLDLNEKMNLPFKYPLSGSMKDRKNLIDVIHDATSTEGTLNAFKGESQGGDDEFTYPLTQAEVAAIGVRNDTIEVQDPTTLEMVKKAIYEPLKRDNVYQFRIKEDWFIEKQRSVMEPRIIGIAPVIKDVDENGEFRGPKVLYWIYFPEARKIFVNHEVFNRFNDAERRTFDDIFMKRFFSSFIIKESNVYDRRIADYKVNTLDALIEAQRIKDDLFNMEHDLWEY